MCLRILATSVTGWIGLLSTTLAMPSYAVQQTMLLLSEGSITNGCS
jgi:hypothetical protein